MIGTICIEWSGLDYWTHQELRLVVSMHMAFWRSS